MDNLPRVRAVAKETLRWRPVTAGGLPHMLIKDDTYKLPNGTEVFLEAGTVVHPVQWAIHREAKLYPDPESFKPERWLEPGWPTYKEPLTKFPNLQNFSAFGFGRRICPGLNIAERSLYILISRIAWSANISRAKDANGQDIVPPDYDYVTGFNVCVCKKSLLLLLWRYPLTTRLFAGPTQAIPFRAFTKARASRYCRESVSTGLSILQVVRSYCAHLSIRSMVAR
jgi:hypothetical protein